MAGQVGRHRERRPRQRLRGTDGYFFTAEMVRLIGSPALDYAQVRLLLQLARDDAHQPSRKWARYDLRDLASIRVAIDVLGGPEQLLPGRRLRLGPLRRACEELRKAGYSHPLLQVPLARFGPQIVALIGGVVFEPVTGQRVINELASGLLDRMASELTRGELVLFRSRIRDERKNVRSRTASKGQAPWTLNLEATAQ